jgi:rhodanese-related sulfurtransferase
MINILKGLSIQKKLAAFAMLLGIMALLIGNSNDRNKITVNAREVALSTVNDQDKINVNTLADWLIKGNADFTLVDLRTEKEFTEYNIPTSINIKMEELLNSNIRRNQKYLFYGRDDIASAQAWFILKSAGYKGVYILKGGMTSWKNQILYPERAAVITPEDSLKFEQVKEISLHFGGAPRIQVSGGQTTSEAPVQVTTPTVPKLSTPAGTTTKKKKEGC